MNSIPVLTIIGKSGSGKTSLLEKIIPRLKQHGYRIAAIKHHSHRGFEIDQPGKDSWRFAQAGSDQVIIAAPDKIAFYRRLEQEASLEEIIAHVTGVDLILVEGYKDANLPTLVVARAANSPELVGNPACWAAIVSDLEFDLDIPKFHPDDVAAITAFIEEKFLT